MDTAWSPIWQLLVVELEGIGGEPVLVWFLANVAAPPLAGGPQWNPAPLAFGALESKPVADLWRRIIVDDLTILDGAPWSGWLCRPFLAAWPWWHSNWPWSDWCPWRWRLGKDLGQRAWAAAVAAHEDKICSCNKLQNPRQQPKNIRRIRENCIYTL